VHGWFKAFTDTLSKRAIAEYVMEVWIFKGQKQGQGEGTAPVNPHVE